MSRKITVVIPTRERADTLVQALETCMWQKDDNFQIIVSDNASADDTRKVVESAQSRDPRVRYINPGHRLSMTAHWEFALGHVNEGLVMVIGDDDGLLPDAIPRVREALAIHPEVLAINSDQGYYKWPTLIAPDPGYLHLGLSPTSELRDAKTWLHKVAQSEAWYAMLPYVYYGFVDASVLSKIREKSSRLIHSSIPDVFLAIAVTSHIEEFLHLYQPLAIVGVSRHSTGHAQVSPGGNRQNADKFESESDIPFHESVPYVPSIHVMTAECILQARDAGLLPIEVPINWERIITRTFVELHSQPFSRDEITERLVPLQKLTQQLSLGEIWVNLTNSANSGIEGWQSKIPCDLEWESGRTDVSLDLKLASTRGIADACQAAYVATQVSQTFWHLKTSLPKHIDSLTQQTEELYREREELYKVRDLLYKDRDLLYKERDILYKERDLLHQERDRLITDCERVNADFSTQLERFRSLESQSQSRITELIEKNVREKEARKKLDKQLVVLQKFKQKLIHEFSLPGDAPRSLRRGVGLARFFRKVFGR